MLKKKSRRVIEKLGIGIDVVQIKRFQDIPYSSNHKFYKKIFLPSEIKYCLKFKDASKHFAGKFAIKEAVKKSICDNIDFLHIQTSHLHFKPEVKLIGNIAKKYNFMISLSHEQEVAVGIVISEKIE